MATAILQSLEFQISEVVDFLLPFLNNAYPILFECAFKEGHKPLFDRCFTVMNPPTRDSCMTNFFFEGLVLKKQGSAQPFEMVLSLIQNDTVIDYLGNDSRFNPTNVSAELLSELIGERNISQNHCNIKAPDTAEYERDPCVYTVSKRKDRYFRRQEALYKRLDFRSKGSSVAVITLSTDPWVGAVTNWTARGQSSLHKLFARIHAVNESVKQMNI